METINVTVILNEMQWCTLKSNLSYWWVHFLTGLLKLKRGKKKGGGGGEDFHLEEQWNKCRKGADGYKVGRVWFCVSSDSSDITQKETHYRSVFMAKISLQY